MRHTFLLLAAAILFGCGAAPRNPRETVAAYFEFLGRDPVRTLTLLSPAFHEQHALHVVTAAEAQRVQRGESPDASDNPADRQLAPDRFLLAWLMIQVRPAYVAQLAGLRVEFISEETDGDRARVTTRVTAPRASAIDQVFTLSRLAGSSWKIDGIEQRGTDATNLNAAFAAHPTEDTRKRIESSVRRR